MNKLQLYIARSVSNYRVLFSINPSEEVRRYLSELRGIVSRIKYDPSEKNIFYYVTNTPTGIFITIIRTIPTEPVDHLAAWIFVPNELIIDAERLEQVINVTTRKVSGERVTTEDVAKLRELFSTEYITDPNAPMMPASKAGGQLAWRRYNGDTKVSLTALLGAGLYQLSYLDYCGVLFIDDDLGVTAEAKDITDEPIKGPAVILPVAKTAENFVAHVFGRPLDGNIRATRDTDITVVWKHPGFEDISVEERITDAEFVPSVPDTSKSRKAITLSSFQIMSQSGNIDLEGCVVTVNSVQISDQPSLFTTSELTSALVTISCEGYTPYSNRMDLASSTKQLVRLQERTKVYCFEMPVKSADLGAPVSFKIYTKRTLNGSPLEGYTACDNVLEGETRINHLVYAGSSPLNANKIVYGVAGLLLGLIIGWLTGCGGGSKSDEILPVDTIVDTEIVEKVITKVPQPSSPKPVSTPQTTAQTTPGSGSTVTADVIAYLDNNSAWTKEGLDKFPALRGLFDDLNNFELEKLSDEWGSKLAASKKFAKLAKHAHNGMSAKKKQKSKIAPGVKFLSGDDTKITYISYINRIDP